MLQRINISDVRRLRKTVYLHFKKQGRSLPWRRDYDPYHIFVSEIMLQQTQVDRVAMKFDLFIKELPDFASLAKTPIKKVLSLWQGLGYNRRALHLRLAAQIIMKEHNGSLPSSTEVLETLPGIGKATAASIASFAFNKPAVFLETNIRTVLIHHFFNDKKSISDADLLPFAQAMLDRKKPRKWYSALMDYGTMLKKLHGNASRRSVHYKKQSRFEGSDRQKRGKILRLLLGQKRLTLEQISKRLEIPLKQLIEILDGLIADGIIIKSKKRYCIT
jgi:A/G-specific adenine glycosylase